MTSPILARPAIDDSALQAIPDHAGGRQDPQFEVFTSPPPELGTILSVNSALKVGRSPFPKVVRVSAPVLLALLGIVVVFALADYVPKQSRDQVVGTLGVGAIVLAFIVYTWAFRMGARNTFVCDGGVFDSTLLRRSPFRTQDRSLRFVDAATLDTLESDSLFGLTEYSYVWRRGDGKQLLKLQGTKSASRNDPKSSDPWHFVAAAERAWTTHFLKRAEKELAEQGSIAFFYTDLRKRSLRLGPGFIEFNIRGEPERYTRDDIASVELGGSGFTFFCRGKDGREKKITFGYFAMSNALAFLISLRSLMGYNLRRR